MSSVMCDGWHVKHYSQSYQKFAKEINLDDRTSVASSAEGGGCQG